MNSLIAGGMMADDLRFVRTFQYCHTQAVSRGVTGVLLGGGGLKIGIGIEHGFAPISKPRRITRARGNTLIELDRQPAASVYEEYFGEGALRKMQDGGLSRQAIAYPLGIQCEGADQWLLRNVVSCQEDGSLTCSGEILEGAWLQLMIGSRELALEGAYKAAQQAIRSLNQVACLLVFDSVARRKLLGEHYASQEIARIRQAVGSVPFAGCYTYGEQAPVGTTSLRGRTAVQTESVLVIALGN